MKMSWYSKFTGEEKVTEEEEDKLIRYFADKVNHYGMELPGVLLLNWLSPFSRIGGQLGRFMVFPFLFMIGDNIADSGYRFISTFENRDNWNRLINLIEEGLKEENKEEKSDFSNKKKRNGWQRFIPF